MPWRWQSFCECCCSLLFSLLRYIVVSVGYCPDPPSPDNGFVAFTAFQEIHSVATFSCLAGYDLQGTSTATCVAGGTDVGTGVWDANSARSCKAVGELHVLKINYLF